MIAVHIGMLAVVLFLWIGGKDGWIPYKKYVEPREYGKILLVLLLGNLLGITDRETKHSSFLQVWRTRKW